VNSEERIDGLRAKGDLRGAATHAIQAYGPELYGFLVTVLRDEADASEVYSQACEDMWRGLPRFEGRCTMKTWLYVLAKHARDRLQRSPRRRPGRCLPLSEVSELAERVRTETVQYLRTGVKDKLASIRNALSEDDRALLVLRIDRGMKWTEIARALSKEGESEEEIRRRGPMLRKRFQRVKDEIRASAERAGLLGPTRCEGCGSDVDERAFSGAPCPSSGGTLPISGLGSPPSGGPYRDPAPPQPKRPPPPSSACSAPTLLCPRCAGGLDPPDPPSRA
jgi:RNA polymerase sigma-70 factor (ECF subfamily)